MPSTGIQAFYGSISSTVQITMVSIYIEKLIQMFHATFGKCTSNLFIYFFKKSAPRTLIPISDDLEALSSYNWERNYSLMTMLFQSFSCSFVCLFFFFFFLGVNYQLLDKLYHIVTNHMHFWLNCFDVAKSCFRKTGQKFMAKGEKKILVAAQESLMVVSDIQRNSQIE